MKPGPILQIQFFSIEIQIRWKFYFTLIQILTKWSLQKCAVLAARHVQKFVMMWWPHWPVMELQVMNSPLNLNYRKISNISRTNCQSLRCSWSIACRRCSNYIFIYDLTSGFKGFGKDSHKIVQKSFKKKQHYQMEVAYNNVFRRFFGYDRFFSQMFVENRVDNFGARMRRLIYGFRERLHVSENCLVIRLINSAAW